MVLWTWMAMKCAQEAGRQTCRFSGIWCSNIVVGQELFDAQRSMVLLYFSVVHRLTGYHPNPGPIFGGTKRQHFAIRTAVNGPLSPQTNPQEVHNCGASELLLTRPDRAFPCWGRGEVWHVFGDTVFFCSRSQISRVLFSGIRLRVAMD